MEIINIPNLGEVRVVRRANVRRLKLTIRPGVLNLSADYSISMNEIIAWIEQNKNKILDIRNQENLANHYSSTLIAIDEKIECCNFSIEFSRVLETDKYKSFAASKVDNRWIVKVPNKENDAIEMMQEIFKRIIVRIITLEAEEYLPQRLALYSQRTNTTYKSLKINSAIGRWGSCSSSKSINLSCYLMMLPLELIDYIIVHELTHTIEMNHGDKFKEIWHSYFPNYSQLDRELKEYSLKLLRYKLQK